MNLYIFMYLCNYQPEQNMEHFHPQPESSIVPFSRVIVPFTGDVWVLVLLPIFFNACIVNIFNLDTLVDM